MAYILTEIRDGKVVRREEKCGEVAPRKGKRSALNLATGGQLSSTWPMASDAAGIHPDQIPEAMAYDAKHGVKTEYTPTGEPVFTDAAHRRRYCGLHALCDRNGGYSDPTPGGYKKYE